jgi:hypothetical protein
MPSPARTSAASDSSFTHSGTHSHPPHSFSLTDVAPAQRHAQHSVFAQCHQFYGRVRSRAQAAGLHQTHTRAKVDQEIVGAHPAALETLDHPCHISSKASAE